MIRQFLFILIVSFLVTGCIRDPKPAGTLDKETFIDVLIDVHIAESMCLEKKRLNMDSLDSRSLYLSVLKKYNVSEDKMLKTTLYYSRHPREYDKIFNEVLSRMSDEIDNLQGVKKKSLEKIK